jgi:biopolymer transport protein ExbD
MADRKIPEINAGSMADIAFLLLVFFLVTTTIQTDAGLYQLLPQWVEEESKAEPPKKNKKNVMQVKITASDQVIVEAGKQPAQINFDVLSLKDRTIEFLTNNGKTEDLSEKPTMAVIVLQNDNGTSYDKYLSVLNELNAAYNTIWNQASKDKFAVAYDALTKEQQEEIKMKYPKFLSEADATDFDKKK